MKNLNHPNWPLLASIALLLTWTGCADKQHAREAIHASSVLREDPCQKIDIVAYYWPAYHVDPRFEELGIFREGKGEWEVIYNAVPKFEGHDQPLVPLWGYEDESDPVVVARKIDAAVSSGVNVWAVDWYWYDGRPFLQGFLENGLLKAPNKDKMMFYLMWANHDMNGYLDQTQHKKDSIFMSAAVDIQEFDRISDYFIDYFREPNYYKIEGKPVFSLYLLDAFIQGIGGAENAKAAFEKLRVKTMAAGFPGLHLQAIIHEWVPDQLEGMESVNTQDRVLQYFGFNSITNYQWIHFMEIGPREDYSEYAKEAVKQYAVYDSDFNLPYFPHVSVGWDCNDRFPPEDPDPAAAPKLLYPNIMDKGIQPTVVNRSPEAFKEALQKARLYLENHPDQPRIITINSWNEWSEGSYLEPDTKRGYKYLEAIREVVDQDPIQKTLSAETRSAELLFGPGFREPFPVKKDTLFRVDNLRSGSVRTDDGWDVQDFAHAFFNPNPHPITIRLKMVCDHPGFVFADGQIGTYTKTYALKPMFGVTDNVFICPVFEEKYGRPDWPVAAGTNFTGSVEFTSPDPFYYYMLHPTPATVSKTMEEAYFAGWDPCRYDEAGSWDPDLDQFVIPYTNYWHNVVVWNVGWYSTLLIRNNTGRTVHYKLRHIPYYGAQYNPENGWTTRFVEQIVDIPVKQKEEIKVTLMELFGWSTTQSANLEGCLLIDPDIPEAKNEGTTVRLLIDPNNNGEPYHDAIF